ncbi:MAG TPA: secondary thiamine-phosphate synthase enzyme YjbQ [Candidatus Hydrogenedentes bacterium]|nr:secondary thiamine-phosphate synthase enzyme YjbQ [Candidatus Hydrogenedentota bacterium]HOL78359.1 secondary thiamine-phosphate synthase enzyme YjbQ [Candidatus Hydrogenedentota bacterium]HPO87575.1 secondary thiamine-phosphate synthase enzyme YjbQ [Candidatus Hydrogenedentota bacterium]
MQEITIRTQQHCQFINIDAQVQSAVDAARIQNGICCIFVPHTTAGITINENADPDVVRDIIATLDKLVPWHGNYAHTEGNSAAHVKASMLGFCQTVLVREGKLALGTWQSIYFCEFDGPRTRKIWITVIPAP